jgi:2-polyprenyl-3-methyl-5-hydroxy-6-metoxy-1,4-benzoquinol methylase
MTAFAGAVGHTPSLQQGSGNPEAQKYGKLWAMEEYRKVSPGESFAPIFLDVARPKPDSTVIDFGCGTGRGGFHLAVFGNMQVTFVDFTRNCLDPEIAEACTTQPRLKFLKHDLETPLGIAAEYGFCTDVMEHIPPDKVHQVLDVILSSARYVFFSIGTTSDSCGKLIGEELHLTVQPYSWWLIQFAARGCVIHWSKETSHHACFYVSAWNSVAKVMADGGVNTEEAEILANVETNCANGWQQVVPHEKNEMELMILGGGPSLSQHLDEIKTMRENGVKLITLNGSYNWAIEHGLTPSAQIMVDAREFNKRFTKPVVDGCRYLICSQCNPLVLDGLPKERTFLWHTRFDLIKDVVTKHYPVAYPIPSCTTVLVTALPLLRMLGFTKFHLFGCDSCVADDKVTHHAYSQPENDDKLVIPVSVTGGRMFYCNPWMAAQADQFIELIKFMGNEFEIEIHGDGLLKAIVEAGADVSLKLEGE